MRIAVVGAGAMGSLFGGCLSEAGFDVALVDRPGPHLRAMQADGLHLDTDAGKRTIAVAAGVAADFGGARDLLIVFTKGPDTEAALRANAHLVGPQTRVLTVQNGLGNAARVRAALPEVCVLEGMTSWPADLRAPGCVASHGHGQVLLWAADGTEDPMAHAVADALAQARLGGVADPGAAVAIWEKVAFNAAMNAVAATSRLPVGAIGDSDAGRRLVAAVVEEAAAVAEAAGNAIDARRVHAATASAFAGHREHLPSMLQDVFASRRTEIEQINGALADEGRRLGVATPVTQTLRDLVRLIEARWPE